VERFPEALDGIPDAVLIVDADGGGARFEFRGVERGDDGDGSGDAPDSVDGDGSGDAPDSADGDAADLDAPAADGDD
jgi:hypothetical protein